MTFFRIKKIKGKEYVYLVENEWGKKGTRQKVKGYLGRSFKLDQKEDIDFLKWKNIDLASFLKNDFKGIISELISWENFRYKMSEQFELNVEIGYVKKNSKDVVLLVNEGYMCYYTLKKLFEFKPINHDNDTFRLARSFVEAGIKVPQDVFIGVCEKLFTFEE